MKKYLLISLLVLPFAVNATPDQEIQNNAPFPIVISSTAHTLTIGDPGFEAGSPSAVWTESSTSNGNGTPICIFGTCGNGTGTGANTGDYWAWFGGVGDSNGMPGPSEDGRVSQMIDMPIAGGIELTFFLEIAVCATTGFLEVLVDGNQEYIIDETDPQCIAAQQGYNQITVDLSAYSGQTVNLEFHGHTDPGLAPINFFVDDIDIVATANPDPIPTASVTGLVLLSILLMFAGRRKLS